MSVSTFDDSSELIQDDSVCKSCCSSQFLFRLLIVTITIGLGLCVWWFFEYVKYGLAYSFIYIQRSGPLWGGILLACLIIVHALTFLPCLPFTLAGGFLYGCIMGSIIVHIASTIAAFLGFIIARYFARSCLEKKLMGKGDSTWAKIDKAIAEDGLKLVLLIRSSPLHPYGLCNYLFGMTSVSLSNYMIGSVIGMLPTTVIEVYFGTALKSFADILGDSSASTDKTSDKGNEENTQFFWIGLISTLAVTVYMTIWLKQKLNTHLDGYQEVELTTLGLDSQLSTSISINTEEYTDSELDSPKSEFDSPKS